MLLIKNRLQNGTLKKYIIPILTIIIFIMFIPYSIKGLEIKSGSMLILTTKTPEMLVRDTPPNCTIFIGNPIILTSTTDLNVVDISQFLSKDEIEQKTILNNTDCALFFEEAHCFGFSNEFVIKNCQKMKEYYNLTSYKVYREKDVNYTLYKINK